MSQFDSIISSMKNESYSAKKQLLEYTIHILQSISKGRKRLAPEDKRALLDYAFLEADAILAAIPAAASYREKDLLFACEDLLLGLIMHLAPTPGDIPQERLAKITLLVETVAKERCIETTIDTLFKQGQISESDIQKLLSLVARTDDEYQKGMLYSGLIHYKDRISRISDAGKALVTAHLTAEFRRYLGQDHLEEDPVNNLEAASDVCKYFPGGELIGLLRKAMALGFSNVNYYAVDTLLSLGESIPAEIIDSLAHDLEYANLTYALLERSGLQSLFPQTCSTPEYLAKSDMVHWLTYPTELGKAPDEIVYIGKITCLFKKDVYHVFRFRSDSDTLNDELKNKWLIGWSSEDGGTFSNFDEYALFEKGSVSATLKHIKRKLIG